jgi:NAD(P)-dependent dehydrogenase (short-subunit alcohol dehydrogenase family)
MSEMKGKVCIVTGSNTGIGKETARGLAARGATVILACRDLAKAEVAREDIARSTGNREVKAMALDLGSKKSILGFVERFQGEHQRLDVLVNNAGVWTTSRTTTVDGFETTFGVNHLGTFLLTRELLPVLKASAPARVVVLSSKLHYQGKMAWEDLEYRNRKFRGPQAYSQSKLANVLFTLALARRLEGTGVSVNAVHPGVVATELARDYPALLVKIFHMFLLTPEQGAACSLHVATAPGVGSGLYFEDSRSKKPSREALDEGAQERLWSLSEQLWG